MSWPISFTGGCCHNYIFQATTLLKVTEEVADIEWAVVNEGGNGTKAVVNYKSRSSRLSSIASSLSWFSFAGAVSRFGRPTFIPTAWTIASFSSASN